MRIIDGDRTRIKETWSRSDRNEKNTTNGCGGLESAVNAEMIVQGRREPKARTKREDRRKGGRNATRKEGACRSGQTYGGGEKGKTNLACEGHEVMFAKGENIDVTNNDHFVVVLGKDCVIDHVWEGELYGGECMK